MDMGHFLMYFQRIASSCPRYVQTSTALCWHLLQFAASASALAYTASVSSQPKKYLIYLTSWGLVLAFATYSCQVREHYN